ncbi:hypothetical protein HANVADRAFT_860 [Hanseniaspora valbyensis NRRL Y-1626]|uniref:Uncharacterized protein n=1 Tax=Hanseniaspora valbyensis NRRL Y-1626 TaxID=766949 RepID=A0A1B7THK8_9ASCO|nr:hypothetical protein HANVADRAFT_860 [Hanseniaspora valbyensis NRRL Y-1626]
MLPTVYNRKPSKKRISSTSSKSDGKSNRHSHSPTKTKEIHFSKNKSSPKAKKSLSLYDIVLKKQQSFTKLKRTNTILNITPTSSDKLEKLFQKNQQNNQRQLFNNNNNNNNNNKSIKANSAVSNFERQRKCIYENEINLKAIINKSLNDPLLHYNKTLEQSFAKLNNINTSLQFFHSFPADMRTLENCKILINTPGNYSDSENVSNVCSMLLVKCENYGQVFLIDHNKTKKIKNLKLNIEEKKNWEIQISKKFLYQIPTGQHYCLKWRVISRQ